MSKATRDRVKGFLIVGIILTCLGLLAVTRAQRTVSTRQSLLGDNPQQPDRPQRQQLTDEERKQQLKEFRSRFAKTDYDSFESNESSEREVRRKRSKHYDSSGIVSKHPSDTGVGTTFISEWYVNLPSLPIKESCAIVVAEAVRGEAHLSTDRTGVYTEFKFTIDDVLKRDASGLAQGDSISASRFGGIVHYSWGHEELYSIAGQNMPVAKKRYVLFLKCTEEAKNYEIVTAYELGSSGVLPLDDPPQFREFKGQANTDFLSMISSTVT